MYKETTRLPGDEKMIEIDADQLQASLQTYLEKAMIGSTAF
jgi:hypothetical protein